MENNNHFRSYRARILFVGLTIEEKLNVEIGLSRYQLFYAREFDRVADPNSFDLICLEMGQLNLHAEALNKGKSPVLIVGSGKADFVKGRLDRPMVLKNWYETIKSFISPIKTPELKSIEVGTIVRSKTTPIFGKGVVVKLESTQEVFVKFPFNKLLPPGKPLRCHISQLQVLGKVDNKRENNNKQELAKSS